MAEEPSREDLWRSFRWNASAIDSYLKLREQFPDEEPDFLLFFAPVHGPISLASDLFGQLESEFERLGMSRDNYLGVLDGNLAAIDGLCVDILRALYNRKKVQAARPHAVANGEAISNALIDLLCCIMLEGLWVDDWSPPHSLLVLLTLRLGVVRSEYLKQWRAKSVRYAACRMAAENPEMSRRAIAKRLGVDVSTISRCLSDPDSQRYIESISNPDLKRFFEEAKEDLERRKAARRDSE